MGKGQQVKRFSVSVGVAVAASIAVLATAATSLGGGVTPSLIHDSFNGTSIDSNVWGWSGTNQPQNVSISQTGGGLTVSVSSAAANDLNAALGTRCKARGNFDARLAFSLVSWPSANGVWVSLNTAGTGGFNAYRVSWLFSTGDEYGVYLPPSGGGTTQASGTDGTLRLTRSGSTWKAYYLSGTTWVQIDGSGTGPTYDIEFNPSVFNLSGVLPFGGQATTVTFRKFTVVADRIVCP